MWTKPCGHFICRIAPPVPGRTVDPGPGIGCNDAGVERAAEDELVYRCSAPALCAVFPGPRLIWKSRLSQFTAPLPSEGGVPEHVVSQALQPPSSSLGTITV